MGVSEGSHCGFRHVPVLSGSVEYLVIGGYALVQYAEPRYTKDLDLWISTDPENAAAVYRALQNFLIDADLLSGILDS